MSSSIKSNVTLIRCRINTKKQWGQLLTESNSICQELRPDPLVRCNTERPITCAVGPNTIVGNDPEKILSPAQKVLDGQWRAGGIPEKWDGHAARHVVELLVGSH
jgi:UDP-N-acetylglucosamine 2-epimerase (non-hydrolysing)